MDDTRPALDAATLARVEELMSRLEAAVATPIGQLVESPLDEPSPARQPEPKPKPAPPRAPAPAPATTLPPVRRPTSAPVASVSPVAEPAPVATPTPVVPKVAPDDQAIATGVSAPTSGIRARRERPSTRPVEHTAELIQVPPVSDIPSLEPVMLSRLRPAWGEEQAQELALLLQYEDELRVGEDTEGAGVAEVHELPEATVPRQTATAGTPLPSWDEVIAAKPIAAAAPTLAVATPAPEQTLPATPAAQPTGSSQPALQPLPAPVPAPVDYVEPAPAPVPAPATPTVRPQPAPSATPQFKYEIPELSLRAVPVSAPAPTVQAASAQPEPQPATQPEPELVMAPGPAQPVASATQVAEQPPSAPEIVPEIVPAPAVTPAVVYEEEQWQPVSPQTAAPASPSLSEEALAELYFSKPPTGINLAGWVLFFLLVLVLGLGFVAGYFVGNGSLNFLSMLSAQGLPVITAV